MSAPEEELRKNNIPGKWSAFEQFLHIATYHETFLARIDQMISSDAPPVFARYVGDTDPLFLSWTQRPKAEVIAYFKTQRRRLTDRLGSLSPGQVAKKGTHPRFGTFPIAGWTEFFLLHEGHHLFSLFVVLHSGN